MLLDLEVCPAPLELLVNAVRLAHEVQVVLPDPLVNVVLLVDEVFLELMDPPDLKVQYANIFFVKIKIKKCKIVIFQAKLVTGDRPVQMDLKVNSETPVAPDLQVCKDFVVYLVVLDLQANQVVLVNAVCPVLTARTANKDHRVSKVFLDLPVFLENVAPW